MAENLLELKDVSINYYGGYNGCSGVTCRLRVGENLCVLGDRLSGKSTLIKGIVGLESYTGKIMLNDKDLSAIKMADRNFGLTLPLPKGGNIRKALEFPLKLRKLPKKEIEKKVYSIANTFGIVHILDFSIKSLTPEQAIFAEAARLFIVDRDVYFIDNIMDKVYITERRVLFPKLLQIIKSLQKSIVYTTDLIEESQQINAEQNIYLSYNRMVDSGDIIRVMKAPYALDLAKFLNVDRINLFNIDITSEGIYYQGKLVSEKIELTNGIFTKAIAMIMPMAVKISLQGDARGKIINIIRDKDSDIAVIESSSGIIHAMVACGAVEMNKQVYYQVDWKKALYYDSNSEMLISKR